MLKYKAILLSCLILVATSAAASYVDPVVVPGNPNCIDLGYDFGFKPQPEPPPSGTYEFPGGMHSLTLTSDGTYFDWTSALGVDAVIVKGGDNANVYVYDPEAFADTVLSSPINLNNDNGQPYAISHIDFCYDWEVTAAKTAETSYVRTWDWDIAKSVTPSAHELFAGGSATSSYAVSVTKTGYSDSAWSVAGTITVTNDTPYSASVSAVLDDISGFGAVAVVCDLDLPAVLFSGQTMNCDYATDLPDGTARINLASVTTDSGQVGGNSATAGVVFGEPTTELNGEVTVGDTHYTLPVPTVDEPTTWVYELNFTCSSDASGYANGHYAFREDNVATIIQTGASDDASVTVDCYAPVVSKTAATTYERSWSWTIAKQAYSQVTGEVVDDLVLSDGQVLTLEYDVTVDASSTDSDFEATGTIAVINPHPSAAMTVSLQDVLEPGSIAATLACGGSLTVPAASSATCDYSVNLPDDSSRTNTATARLNGIAFTGNAAVTFGDPSETFHECVDLTDAFDGEVPVPISDSAVCVGDLPATFTYPIEVGPYADCETAVLHNVASFASTEVAPTTGNAEKTVTVSVPCQDGCTLTPGYWKTHSIHGPAPYDDTWLAVGEDSEFFLSTQTWYDVLWTPPKGGNAYYILAHAYIASVLNGFNEADTTDVTAALTEATDLFSAYTPEDIASLKNKKPADAALRAEFLSLAATLDAYNNGALGLGPGHCSE